MINRDVKKAFLLFAVLLLVGVFFAGGRTAYAATGDIQAVTILGPNTDNTASTTYNGWTANITFTGFTSTSTTNNMGLGTNNSPGTAKIVFTVSSPGYDNNGNVTTVTRTIYGTKVLRLPYPANGNLDESTGTGSSTIKIALSDFIYQGETVTGVIASGIYTDNGSGGTSGVSNASTSVTVINNSALAYPKAVGRWAWPGYERETGDFLVEATIFDRFSRNGQPLAAVVFTASDTHGHTAYATSSTMTKSTRTGDANTVLVYAGTIPVTTLTQGDVVTVNFKAYPWVGTSTALNSDLVSNGGDGVAQPDERLGPLYEVLDKTGAYGPAFAVVDDTNGLDTNATTYVGNVQATVESDYNGNSAHSYKSIGRAEAAIKAYNSATYSRNEPGGGVILLNSGNHVYPGTSPSESGSMNTWLIITPMSSVSKANAIINGGGNSGQLNTQRVKISGVTITKAGTAAFQGRLATDVLWVDNDSIDTTTGAATFYIWNQVYATQNSLISHLDGFESYNTGATRDPFSLIRGNAYLGSASFISDVYMLIGNSNILTSMRWLETGNTQGQQISDNAIIAFNTQYVTSVMSAALSTNVTSGNAIVQNVFESLSAPNPILSFASNSQQLTSTNNIIVWNNTFAGARQNLAYNAYGSTAYPHTNWSIVGNQIDNINIKSDTNSTFDTANGGRTGNWSVVFGVGARSNKNNITQGFEPEFIGLSSVAQGVGSTGYVSDKSLRGTEAGNGDYHLTSSSAALNLIASGQAVLPFDIDGNPRRNDGTGAAGAYEYITAPTVPSIPTSVTAATSSPNQATVSFAPGSDGGSAILYYLASSTPGNFTATSTGSPIVVPGLTNGTSYTFAVYAVNAVGTSSPSSASNAVTPTATLDTTPPGISGGSPSGAQSAGTAQVTLSLTTDEAATCRYSTTANTAYDSMTGNFSTTGNTSHSTLITGLSNGSSYTYYVRCIDTSNNPNTSDYTISFSVSSPAPSGGGGSYSSGGSAYVAPVPIATTTATTTAMSNCETLMYPVITKQLSPGMTGNDVVLLQKILVLEKFFTTSSSSGTYGPQTMTAVSSFQKKYGIVTSGTPQTTGFGNVGPKTRAFINQFISQRKYSSLGQCVTSAPVSNAPTTNTQPYTFTRSLTVGSTGSDVKVLQVFLNTHGFIVTTGGNGSPGHETTYYGSATAAAISRFQMAHALQILTPYGLTQGTGNFGAVTMAKVNQMLGR